MSKNCHFCKGVNSWFLYKNGHFSNFFFLGKIGHENVFYNILEGKNTFEGYKNKKFKKLKNCYFSKGVNPWFWSKNGHFFNCFFFRQYRPGKCLLQYSRPKKTPFQAIKTRSLKSRKIAIIRRGLTHGFVAKIAIFQLFFLGIVGQKNVFYDFQNEKTPFQAIKSRSSKSRKIAIFPKVLTQGFGPKMAIFPTSFFQAIYARKMSFTIFQNEKTPFLAMKTRRSKSRKISIFPKGLTHGFGPKMVIFPTSFFLAKQGRKMSFTIFQNQKTSLQEKFIKVKNSYFSKGVNPCCWSKNGRFSNLFFTRIRPGKCLLRCSRTKKRRSRL